MSEVIFQGDVLVTPKDMITNISHYAVYAGKSEDGTDWMIHNNIGTGVSWVQLNQLLQNGHERIDRFIGKNYERIKLVEKAKSMLGKTYSVINFNCEHFARLVKDGVCESRQLKNFTIGIAFIVVMYLLFKSEE